MGQSVSAHQESTGEVYADDALPIVHADFVRMLEATDAGAIDGYDPVAYFTQGEAVQGAPQITAEYGGATWHFANEMHRQLFVGDPGKYAPQYGGYCAYGMAGGYTAYTDPTMFTVVDESLYLNYDASVQQDWQADRESFIRTADVSWQGSGLALLP